MVLSVRTLWTSAWPRSHSLVTLLLTYYDTRRRCSSLHDDTLGTIAPGNFYVTVAPLPLWRLRVDASIVFTVEAHLLSVQLESMMVHPNT